MKIQSLVVGPVAANCYLLFDEGGKGIVIDPGGDAPAILDTIRKEHITVEAILNTHGHSDHIAANDAVRNATGAPLYIHAADENMLTDPRANLSLFMGGNVVSRPAEHHLKEGDILCVGAMALKVLHTPGHSPGGVCFAGEGVLFSGDTLFADSIGRTDFPGGSLPQLIGVIKEKLMALPDDTVVYAGHGPSTTIGRERQYNPYLNGFF
ncbi:MAG: MBL fold metallo-hydrolase [Schwartzia sp. (in: firmicutes)]